MSTSTPPKLSFKDTFVTHLWQPVKALICIAHLYIAQTLALRSLNAQVEYWQWWHYLVLALNALFFMVLLYHFYDDIDDLAFFALRAEKMGKQASAHSAELDPDLADLEALYGGSIPHYEEENAIEPTHLMKKPSWILAYVMGIVGFGYFFGICIASLLAVAGMSPTLSRVLGYGVGGLLFAGIRLWRVCVLNNTWRIQIDLVKPGAKKYASIFKRIFQCVAMTVAMMFLCYYVAGAYFMVVMVVFVVNLVINFATEFPSAAIGIVVVGGGLLLWVKLRLLLRWRKFFSRLKKAKARGEIDYKVEGSPYLSALFPKLYAGVVVTDLQRYKGKEVTYLVAICNVSSRREAVILCDEYRVQIRHSVNLRLGGRALAIAASAENSGAKTGHSILSWYTTMGIEFPAGEGQRVLIVDPAPTGLYLRDGQSERLQSLDNGSRAYDYTVWTKNAFFNMIERT